MADPALLLSYSSDFGAAIFSTDKNDAQAEIHQIIEPYRHEWATARSTRSGRSNRSRKK